MCKMWLDHTVPGTASTVVAVAVAVAVAVVVVVVVVVVVRVRVSTSRLGGRSMSCKSAFDLTFNLTD